MYIDGDKRVFRDASHAHVIFHGVNIVYKQDPYLPDTENYSPNDSLTEEDMQDLENWGFNIVRLGVIWEAVEKEPGVYDEDYLNKIEKLINELGDHGIYTIVDAHQDVASRITCGEGIPSFYAQEILSEAHKYCLDPVLDYVL